MDLSKLYNRLIYSHAALPYFLGKGKSLPPIRIQLDLTYRCNLRCKMCYQDKFYKKGENELSSQEWINIISQLPRFCLITLFGGEPLVRKDFKEIAEKALHLHPCNLVTNAVLLTQDISKFLIDKKLLLLGVSLDGTGKIHDKVRGVTGTYKKVIDNLKNLQKLKKNMKSKFPLLDIKTVVTKTNQDNLLELYKKVVELEADFFTISLPKVSEDQFNPRLNKYLNKNLSLDFSLFDNINFPRLRTDLKKINPQLPKTKIRFYPNFGSIDKIKQELYNPNQLIKNFSPCVQPWSGLQIGATGKVYPCLSLEVGDARKQKLSDIWNGKSYIDFRKNLKNCGLFPACVGCCYLKNR